MARRFKVEADGCGSWLVKDTDPVNRSTMRMRTAAICADRHDANAVCEYMNGESEGGRLLHAGFQSRLMWD